MDPITIGLQIVTALASSGAAPSLITGLVRALGGDKAADVASTLIKTAQGTLGTTDQNGMALKIAQDKSAADRFIAEVTASTEQFRLEVMDIQDARKRDVIISERHGTNRRANVMVLAAFLYLMIGTSFIFFNITELASPGAVAVMTFLTTTMGNVAAMLMQAFGFEFGSSRSSAEKSATINEMLKR